MNPSEPPPNDAPALRRELGLTLLTLYGLGNILGAGIYVLVGKVAGSAGMFAPVSFLVACALAALTALSYAELSARLPLSAGEAIYVERGLRSRPLGVVVGLLIAASGVVSAATIARGFVGYLHVFVAAPDWLVIVGVVCALGALAAWGIGVSSWAAAAITVVETGGLLLIIGVAGDNLADLSERFQELVPPLDGTQWQGILLGSFLAFYAFIGFEDMVNVAEEVREPTRTLPLGIFLALGTATALYLLVALVAVLTVPPDALGQSAAPLALVYQEATGTYPVWISLISLFAVVNGALIQIIMASRIAYGMSRQGWLPRRWGRIHPHTRTPMQSTAAVTTAVLILAIWLPLVGLAQATSFLLLIVFCFVHLSLWRIKRSEPGPPGVRTYPIWVPVLGFAATGIFVLFQLWQVLSP